MGFMALVPSMVLCARSQDSLLSVYKCVGYMSYSRLLDLKAEGSCGKVFCKRRPYSVVFITADAACVCIRIRIGQMLHNTIVFRCEQRLQYLIMFLFIFMTDLLFQIIRLTVIKTLGSPGGNGCLVSFKS